MKIYTKTGDSGMTGLFAGPRVSKDHPRIHAYGAVDELNSTLGVVDAIVRQLDNSGQTDSDQTALGPALLDQAGPARGGGQSWSQELSQEIRLIQSDLFSIGAQLATPQPERHDMCLLKPERVAALEDQIDRVEQQLEPLKSFILPAGSLGSAMLHVARTVCRRAEREVVTLSQQAGVGDSDLLLIYLNRLSDLLFVWARAANRESGVADLPWKPAD